MTVAPLCAASSTIMPPVTPAAPFTRIVSPGWTSSASDTTCSAVSAGTGNAAASAQDALRGFSATRCAEATSRSAQQPWYGSGSGCVITAAPAAGHSTSGPTPTTSPAASTPSAKGGTRPTSRPPVRTNSSQFPTPAALTSISTCPVSSGGGSGSSRSATSSPNASIPAALKVMRGLSRDLDLSRGWRRRVLLRARPGRRLRGQFTGYENRVKARKTLTALLPVGLLLVSPGPAIGAGSTVADGTVREAGGALARSGTVELFADPSASGARTGRLTLVARATIHRGRFALAPSPTSLTRSPADAAGYRDWLV